MLPVAAATWAPVAFAVDTNIGVSVCGSGSPGAHIQITEPVTDSVVNQAAVVFRGTASNASQVEVAIDGQYANTIAIGVGQATFSTMITLTEGTHTIAMTANDICGGVDAVDEVVVTYTPAAEAPSNGNTTPTVIDGQSTTPSTDGQIDMSGASPNIVQRIEQLPVIGAAVSVVADFAAAIGLESTVAAGGSATAAGVARVGVTVAALTTIVMASTLAPMAAQSIPGVSEAFNVKSHRSMLYLGWIIRGAGVLAMAFAYFL